MFNKQLSKTIISIDSFVDLSDTLDYFMEDEAFVTTVDYFYLKNYFIPKIFNPKNRLAAENFVNNPTVFKDAAHTDLLKNCDLTEFIIEHKDSLKDYPLLYECTAGFKISDEAAWILMENCQFGSTKLDLNFYSVWMRPFENEDTGSEEFKIRLERALKSKEDRIYDALNEEEVFYGHNEVNKIKTMMKQILEFHLNVAPEVTDYSPFFVNKHFKYFYATLDEKVLFWVVGRMEPEYISRCPVLMPILMYSKNVPANLKPHVEVAKRHFNHREINEKYAHIWKETLDTEDFKELSYNYPHSVEGLFIDLETEWNKNPDNLIEKIKDSYNNCHLENLNKSRVNLFKSYLKKYLEDKYKISIPFPSLHQLLSIHDSINESVDIGFSPMYTDSK